MDDITRYYLIIIESTVALGLILAKSFIHCKLAYWQAFVSSDMYFFVPSSFDTLEPHANHGPRWYYNLILAFHIQGLTCF